MVELMVGEYGYLYGGESSFPVHVTEHHWETPYPTLAGTAEFAWEPGDLGRWPNIFHHPEIRDWVCDKLAWSILAQAASSDLRFLGIGDLNGTQLYVIQVVGVLDVVDRERSIIEDYGSFELLSFPAFVANSRDEVNDRIFRVPGSYTDLFMGAGVRSALDDAGVTGLAYTPVEFGQG